MTRRLPAIPTRKVAEIPTSMARMGSETQVVHIHMVPVMPTIPTRMKTILAAKTFHRRETSICTQHTCTQFTER